jgi:hypothetical protein
MNFYSLYYGYSPYDYDSYVGAPSNAPSFFSNSTFAKVAIVAGGALAIYLIFQISKSAERLEPVHRGVGRVAGKVARARYGGKVSGLLGGASSTSARLGNRNGREYSSNSLLGSTDSYKLLTE